MSRYRNLGVLVATVLAFGALAFAGSAHAAVPAPNPSPSGRGCLDQFNVAIMIDRSSSITETAEGGNPANPGTIKAAVNQTIQAIAGYGSTKRVGLSVMAFATNVVSVYPTTAGFTQISGPGAVSVTPMLNAVNALQFGNGNPYPLSYGTGPNGARTAEWVGNTNWEGALLAPPSGTNLIIMITDGNPSWWTGQAWVDQSWMFQDIDLQKAIEAANGRKALGTRVVGIRFGNNNDWGYAWESNIQNISGTVRYSGSTVPAPDYYVSSYASLAGDLMTAMDVACTPTTTTTTAPLVTTTTAPRYLPV